MILNHLIGKFYAKHIIKKNLNVIIFKIRINDIYVYNFKITHRIYVIKLKMIH